MNNREKISVEVLVERVQSLDDSYTNLASSYKILNDHHAQLKLDFVEFRTQVQTAVSLAKWLFALNGVSLLLRILELGGVIN